METKTFTGRAPKDRLAYADEVARSKMGMSFAQYCAGPLIDLVYATDDLPTPPPDADERSRKVAAVQRIKEFAKRIEVSNPAIATMTDDELKELIASRYE